MSIGNTGFVGEVLNVGVIHRSRGARFARRTRAAQRAFGVLAAVGLCTVGSVAPAAASGAPDSGSGGGARLSPVESGWGLDSSGECKFGGKNIKSMPWSLQRIMLEQLWGEATGKGVKVAVIDTGVDKGNKQIAPALVGGGGDFVGSTKGTTDINGHGTRVAGIIAAHPMEGTGFTGIAPEAGIIPLRYTGGEGEEGEGDAYTMADAIDKAVGAGADIINISSDTVNKNSITDLKASVDKAVKAGVMVVAAAGNDGADNKLRYTYPASYDGVIAVAASDRNNDRAVFSQRGSFVDVAAPGVGMVSTVPKGGQCAADGTSFAAPYVAGVLALMEEKYGKDWTPQQIEARLKQTANRPGTNPDDKLGWGVVDPVAALTGPDEPQDKPIADKDRSVGQVTPMKLTVGESTEQRNQRISVYVVAAGTVLTLFVGGGAVAVRDYRRKQAARADTGTSSQ